jgi:hypothetical protein
MRVPKAKSPNREFDETMGSQGFDHLTPYENTSRVTHGCLPCPPCSVLKYSGNQNQWERAATSKQKGRGKW